jgi:hypothetical protein
MANKYEKATPLQVLARTKDDVVSFRWTKGENPDAGDNGVDGGGAIFWDASKQKIEVLNIYSEQKTPDQPLIRLHATEATFDQPLLELNQEGSGLALKITNGAVEFASAAFTSDVGFSGDIGFFGTTPVAVQDVSGATGANAALTSLIAALVAYGLITDSTTP